MRTEAASDLNEQQPAKSPSLVLIIHSHIPVPVLVALHLIMGDADARGVCCFPV